MPPALRGFSVSTERWRLAGWLGGVSPLRLRAKVATASGSTVFDVVDAADVPLIARLGLCIVQLELCVIRLELCIVRLEL